MDGRSKKVSYKRAFYVNFKKDFPEYYKQVYTWKPYDPDFDKRCIEIWLDDGRIFVYDSYHKTFLFTKRHWKKNYGTNR